MNADRHVRKRVSQDERALQHALRRDPVRDVDDLRLRSDALDHTVAGPHEIVLETEVGQERDDHDGGTIRRTASTRPSRSCVSASATTSTPAAAAVVCGPMETAGAETLSAAYARAADADASMTSSTSGKSAGCSS